MCQPPFLILLECPYLSIYQIYILRFEGITGSMWLYIYRWKYVRIRMDEPREPVPEWSKRLQIWSLLQGLDFSRVVRMAHEEPVPCHIDIYSHECYIVDS